MLKKRGHPEYKTFDLIGVSSRCCGWNGLIVVYIVYSIETHIRNREIVLYRTITLSVASCS